VLDLQAQYLPAKETAGPRAVSPAIHNRKPAARQNSFTRALDRASDLKSQQNQPADTEKDRINLARDDRSDTAKTLPWARPDAKIQTTPKKSEPDSEQASLKPDNTSQASIDEADSQLASTGDKTENSELDAAFVSDISQLVIVVADAQIANNQIINSNNSSGVDAENSSSIQVDSLAVNAAPAEVEIAAPILVQSMAEPVSADNELKPTQIGDQPAIPALEPGVVPTTGTGIEIPSQVTSQVQPQADSRVQSLIVLAATGQDVSVSEPDAVNELTATEGNPAATQPNTTAVKTADLQADMVAPVQETAETTPTAKQSTQQDEPVKQESADESGNKVVMNPEKTATTPEELRLKILEKLLQASSEKSSDDPANTNLKKLLTEEIQRMRAEKPAAEPSISLEAPASKTQPELNQLLTGVEKLLLSPSKTGLDVQTSSAQLPASNVDPQDLVEQIVKNVELLNKASSSEMKIQLKPEFLGKMMIKIAIEDGVVTARFTTESQQVKHLLEANMGSLKQSLESQGLRVDRTEVNVQLDNGGAFHGNDSGRQQMWQEYAERNNYNRLSSQARDEYGGVQDLTLEPYGETNSMNTAAMLGDGKVDFMI